MNTKFELSADMLRVIFAALQEVPYRYANPVINELTRQMNLPESNEPPPSV